MRYNAGAPGTRQAAETPPSGAPPSMTLPELPRRIDALPCLDDILGALRTPGSPCQVDGIAGVSKALLIARIHQRTGARILVLTSGDEQMQRMADDLRNFGVPEEQLFILPASEGRWQSRDATDWRQVGERVAGLVALGRPEPCIVVATAEGASQRVGAPADILNRALELKQGDRVEMDAALGRLAALGYEIETTVTRPGQFARRGGILDIYPITGSAPIRLDFFGDEVERIRVFDAGTQRSLRDVSGVSVYPAREFRLTSEGINRALPSLQAMLKAREAELRKLSLREAADRVAESVGDDLTRLESGVWFDGIEEYIEFLTPVTSDGFGFAATAPDGAAPAILVVDDPDQVRIHWENHSRELSSSRNRRRERGELLFGADPEDRFAPALERAARELPTLALSAIPRVHEGFEQSARWPVTAMPIEGYRSRLNIFAAEIRNWIANRGLCVLVSSQPHRVREICGELGLPVSDEGETGPGGLVVTEGKLRQGLKFAEIGLFLATDAELFGASRPVAARKRSTGGVPISTLLDLRPGDYVVHVNHGIGVYRGLVKRISEGAEKDFLHIQYAGVDRLFVPADQIDRVQRYIGTEGAAPTVNRIGGVEWQRTTRKAREQAKLMAKELIDLYAARQAAERPPYGEDSLWQAEMEEAFPYDETPSQLRAINDVKADMDLMRPADRLICGDVGFGKTEVAIRAAFKVVEAGRQVAVLCPTTVLAAQHHSTFSERLAAYPIEVELMSRFRTRQQQKETIERVRTGVTDILIGTHRLLSKDVRFSKLGMVIVDEEQRFGVAQKEQLKLLRKTVDVVTLTATPIPRTLSMALSGLRDMSVIEDPPMGRVPIITYVREFEDDVVRDAVLREIQRGGQVYIVHNRVESIDHLAQRIQRLLPDARIRVGHGQMSEDELERIMFDFYHHVFDILVCTTIIENGLDISNANTIIVDHADHLGLAQLYQLRGRVGRSSRQAYAYLLVRAHKKLSEEAQARLQAIREFTALGSGFQIAMRDLEIRGAGNLLGAQQSGAVCAVGFDLYCELLAQAVSEARGEEIVDETLPPADLPVTAHIPRTYIPGEADRIFFYKRMASVRDNSDVDLLLEELEDRFGSPPESVWNALNVLRLRLRAKKIGLSGMRGEKNQVTVRFGPTVHLTAKAIRSLTHMFPTHRFLADSMVLGLSGKPVLGDIEEMIDVLEHALAPRRPGL